MKVAAAALLAVPLLTAQEDQFTAWSELVHLGPGANSVHSEFQTTVARDGLSLYFQSDRPGGFGDTDIWVSRRAVADDPWGPAENAGPFVNSEFGETSPELSLDGHWLYFTSNRPGGFGGSDLYVSRRQHQRDDFGWGPATNLGAGVNSVSNEGAPAIFEDDLTGTITLYFFSPRPGGPGMADIYASSRLPDGDFGPALLVEELSSPGADIAPDIRRDGLEMFITSNRAGSMPFPPPATTNSFDVWVSSRPSTAHPWSVPFNLGPVINSNFNEGWTALAFDSTTLYIAARHPGAFGESGLDLYMSTRSKLRVEAP